MYYQSNPNDMPGLGSSILNMNRQIWLGRQGVQYLPGGGRIDGAASRDPSNSTAQWEASGASLPPGTAADYTTTLQAGLLMGVISSYAADAGVTLTSASNTKYAPSVLGLVGGDNLAQNATAIKVPAAVGKEVLRRVGATGNLTIIGPPTAGATNASFTVTLTSITQNNSTYWTLNVGSAGLTAAVVAGSLICAADGTQNPVTFIDEEDGMRVTDPAGNSLTIQFPRVPIAGGMVNTANLINYTTGAGITGTAAATITVDASVRKWIKAQLNSAGTAAVTAVGPTGAFRFSDDYPN